jgi:hypothetical protein
MIGFGFQSFSDGWAEHSVLQRIVGCVAIHGSLKRLSISILFGWVQTKHQHVPDNCVVFTPKDVICAVWSPQGQVFLEAWFIPARIII